MNNRAKKALGCTRCFSVLIDPVSLKRGDAANHVARVESWCKVAVFPNQSRIRLGNWSRLVWSLLHCQPCILCPSVHFLRSFARRFRIHDVPGASRTRKTLLSFLSHKIFCVWWHGRYFRLNAIAGFCFSRVYCSGCFCFSAYLQSDKETLNWIIGIRKKAFQTAFRQQISLFERNACEDQQFLLHKISPYFIQLSYKSST